MSIALGYYLETGILGTLCLLLWFLLFIELLSLRFTSRRRWIDMRIYLLASGTIGLIIQSIRSVDINEAFLIFPLHIQHALHSQETACLLDATAIVIIFNSRSLYAQIQKPMPRGLTCAGLLPAVYYHISSIILSFFESHYHNDHLSMNKIDLLKRASFAVCGWLFLGLNITIWAMIYKRVAKFVRSLEMHEKMYINGLQQVGKAAKEKEKEKEKRMTAPMTVEMNAALVKTVTIASATETTTILTCSPSTDYTILIQPIITKIHPLPASPPSRHSLPPLPPHPMSSKACASKVADLSLLEGDTMKLLSSPAFIESDALLEADTLVAATTTLPPPSPPPSSSSLPIFLSPTTSPIIRSPFTDPTTTTSSSSSFNSSIPEDATNLDLNAPPSAPVLTLSIDPSPRGSIATTIVASSHRGSAVSMFNPSPLGSRRSTFECAQMSPHNRIPGVAGGTRRLNRNSSTSPVPFTARRLSLSPLPSFPSATSPTMHAKSLQQQQQLGLPSSPSATTAAITANTLRTSFPFLSATNSPALSRTTSSLHAGASLRIDQLHYAQRKMQKLQLFAAAVFITAMALDFSIFVRYFRKEEETHNDTIPPTPDVYQPQPTVAVWLQVLGLGLCFWYGHSPYERWWSTEGRKERNTPFWRTLWYGLEEEQQKKKMLQQQQQQHQSSHGARISALGGASSTHVTAAGGTSSKEAKQAVEQEEPISLALNIMPPAPDQSLAPAAAALTTELVTCT